MQSLLTLTLIIRILIVCLIMFLIVLITRTLMKYIKSKDVHQEKSSIKKSLGETLKAHRIRCHMTQEFVAEAVGVSRQAVSKWETGSSDPSTSNLLLLAELFNISAEELLKEIR